MFYVFMYKNRIKLLSLYILQLKSFRKMSSQEVQVQVGKAVGSLNQKGKKQQPAIAASDYPNLYVLHLILVSI